MVIFLCFQMHDRKAAIKITVKTKTNMKYIITLAALLVSGMAFSNIFTVSNNPSVAAQYTDLQAAHNAAQSGDTLLIAGSTNNYSGTTFTKTLVLVGAGWNGPGLAARMSAITVNGTAQGCKFQGLLFIDYVTVNAANIEFKECWINQLTYNSAANNLLVRNCSGIYRIDGVGSASGVIFTNCYATNKNMFNSNQPDCLIIGNNSAMAFSTLFTNCVFYNIATQGCYNVSMSNNLIHQILATQPNLGGTTNNCPGFTFARNLITCTSCPLSALGGNPTLVGNLTAANQFVSAPQTALDFASSTTAYNLMNFNLVNGSVGINAGTDGTNIGVQGGAYPPNMNSGNGGFSTTVPYINSFVINNPIIQQGGTLNIQATSIIPGN